MLTPVAMAENLIKSMSACGLNWAHKYCLHTVETAKLSIIQNSVMSAIQGLLKH